MTVESQPLAAFLDAIASENVTPAGGTATAVAGAIGASLCEMACIHADAAEAGGAPGEALRDARRSLAAQRDHLLTLANADADVVDDLFGEGADESAGDDAASKRAIGIPLATAEAALNVLEAAAVVTEAGVGNAAADAAIGAYLARAALDASVFTVRSNASFVADEAFVEETTARCDALTAASGQTFERVLAGLDEA